MNTRSLRRVPTRKCPVRSANSGAATVADIDDPQRSHLLHLSRKFLHLSDVAGASALSGSASYEIIGLVNILVRLTVVSFVVRVVLDHPRAVLLPLTYSMHVKLEKPQGS